MNVPLDMHLIFPTVHELCWQGARSLQTGEDCWDVQQAAPGFPNAQSFFLNPISNCQMSNFQIVKCQIVKCQIVSFFPALRCKNGWRGRLLTRCGRRSNPPELVLSSARATCAWSFFYFLRASQICFVRVFFIWLISLFRWCVVFKRSTARLWPARCSATSGAQFLILTWNLDRDDPKTRAEFLTLAKDS